MAMLGPDPEFVIHFGATYIKAGVRGQSSPIVVPSSVTYSEYDYNPFAGLDALSTKHKRRFKPLQDSYEGEYELDRYKHLDALTRKVVNEMRLSYGTYGFRFRIILPYWADNESRGDNIHDVINDLLGNRFFGATGIGIYSEPKSVIKAVRSEFPQELEGKDVIVLYSGGEETYAVTYLHDGFVHQQRIKQVFNRRIPIGGEHVTERMKQLLVQRDFDFQGPGSHLKAENIKECTCFVSKDFEDDLFRSESGSFSDDLEVTYSGSDGIVYNIGSERFEVPEILFQPSMIGFSCEGIHSCLKAALNEQSSRSENDFVVILSGGNTMLKGFDERLMKECPEIKAKLIGDIQKRRIYPYIGLHLY